MNGQRLLMMRVALCFGRIQAWYAIGYRQGTRLERAAILLPWLMFQGLFAVTFAVAQRLGRWNRVDPE